MTATDLRDAHPASSSDGTPRPGAAVLRIRGQVHLRSDTTVGSGVADHGADTRIARDTATCRPIWAGTGQAGALRHHLAAVLGDTYAEQVFGTGDTDSAVRTTDALAYTTSGGYPATSMRTGNRIDSETGIVDPGAVFTDEVLPAGTIFFVDWSIRADPDRLLDIAAAFVRAVDGLNDDSIRLGTRAGKGRGAAATSHWHTELHDLGTAAGFKAWYTRERTRSSSETDGENSPALHSSDTADVVDLAEHLDAVLPGTADRVRTLRSIDRRTRIIVTAILAVAETALTGSDDHNAPGTTERRATMVQGHSAAEEGDRGPLARAPLHRPTGIDGTISPVDSGSAVHSMLKRHARWILHTLAHRTGDPDTASAHADALLEDLFGSSTRDGRTPRRLRSSRVRVSESPLGGGSTEQLPHVRLNPLTQGAVDNHLFFEEVLVGGTSEITITVSRASLRDLGILNWILRDLSHGAGPAMGAAVTNGHGRRLLTTATLDLPSALTGDDTDGPRAQSLSDYFDTSRALHERAHRALEHGLTEGLS